LAGIVSPEMVADRDAGRASTGSRCCFICTDTTDLSVAASED
jgi:hypothetical protein